MDPAGKEHVFWLQVEDPEVSDQPQCWTFRVWRTNTPGPSDDFYEAKFTSLNEDTVFSEYLGNHGHSWAIKKGISEALFEAASAYLTLAIVSSRQSVANSAEWQTSHARNMWNRIVLQGRASFEEDAERYRYIPQPTRVDAQGNQP